MTHRRAPTWVVVISLAAVSLPANAQRVSGSPHVMERTLMIGTPTVLEVDAPIAPYKVVFEDDGETGYFYAVDMSRPQESQILDAVSIYSVADVTRRSKAATVRVRWSRDGKRAALFLNSEPQAVFDFGAKRGYARSNFPSTSTWSVAGHAWSDSAIVGFEK